MASYTPTNWVAHETLISADRMNNIEQGIAALYPQETIIAPEQTVTITAETDPMDGVPITLAEGYSLPETLPNDWTVTVDGKTLEYSNLGTGAYTHLDDEADTVYICKIDEGRIFLIVRTSLGVKSAGGPAPGTYTVKITVPATQADDFILAVFGPDENNNIVCSKKYNDFIVLGAGSLKPNIICALYGTLAARVTYDVRHSKLQFTFFTGYDLRSAVIFTMSSDNTITESHYTTNIELTPAT